MFMEVKNDGKEKHLSKPELFAIPAFAEASAARVSRARLVLCRSSFVASAVLAGAALVSLLSETQTPTEVQQQPRVQG